MKEAPFRGPLCAYTHVYIYTYVATRGIMKSLGENRAVWKRGGRGVRDGPRQAWDKLTGWPMTRGVVTGAPLGSYSTHSSPVPYSPTRLAFASLFLSTSLLSLHFPVRGPQRENLSNTRREGFHARRDLFYGNREERERSSMQISYSNFSLLFCSRWRGGGLIERRKPLTVPQPCVFPW